MTRTAAEERHYLIPGSSHLATFLRVGRSGLTSAPKTTRGRLDLVALCSVTVGAVSYRDYIMVCVARSSRDGRRNEGPRGTGCGDGRVWKGTGACRAGAF